ncbi:hypothetical protein S40285_10782 [Stachybotrys chlorohalonatus IBT 40285]|uniref:Heme haloperoxidase family profile domain-containing protein n=1 Tax=Stachybotrys chlorohalonatus (strain IBT 40285) TaxID=1283841 RepID=A0A084Q816_STAC4|nr:hypothetical protein S40285_10782 [Stachybotrys chlorohalonata IBT 40285]
MRATVLLEVVLFITTVWAGGYQGVLERVLLYYAYEIDGLNPEAERTVGYSCRGEFNSATGQCPGGWVAPQSRGPRANFNELVGPLSSLNRNSLVPFARDSNGNPLLLADGANGLDPERTALNMYPRILAATTSHRYPDGRIPNPPAYKMRRGATDNFVELLSDLGKLVQQTSRRNDKYASHIYLFDGFQRANNLVLDARMDDHGSCQIAGIGDRLTSTGITVRTKTVGSGTNPATGEPWDVVDWKRTIDDGVTDTGRSREEVTSDVEAAARDFYTNNNGAMDHKPVIDATRRTAQRMNHCGP